ATAQRIIADRQAQGPFKTIADLQRVSGIGEKKYAALVDSICV
ncbi:MAG: helix-hairpin-helix domain-containing protein, partial [Raoultibacter sp.]